MSDEQKTDASKPNIIQQALRIATYPLAIATAFFYGHKVSRENTVKFYEERGEFKKLDKDLNKEYASAKQKGILTKEVARELNKKGAKGITKFLKAMKYEKPGDYLKANLVGGRANAMVSATGAAAIVVGLGSFLSENKGHAAKRSDDKNSGSQLER